MLKEAIILAIRAIRRNVLRSALTILGIVIGVAAVINMVTVGSGATTQVTNEISELGGNMLVIRPGQRRHGPGGARGVEDRFSIADAQSIITNVAGLSAVAPVSQTGRQAIYGGANWSTTIIGSTNGYLTVRNWYLAAGRVFTSGEEKAGADVCILGNTLQRELFDEQSAIGRNIRLGKLSFRVVGVLAPKGQSSFGTDQDDLVIIPLRTLQRRMAGNTDVQTILVAVNPAIETSQAQRDITALMRERRGLRTDDANDFHVRDLTEISDTLSGTTAILTALLSAVAGVSLLVGGIGIMNIMMVSVTERTREIGTRLAIGALERDVLLQFLVEATVLTSLGGVLGIAVGLSTAVLFCDLIGVPFMFRADIVGASLLVSSGVGIVFGFFPAKKAASLDPIEALRYE